MSKKILVVDDDKKIRTALAIRLRSAGYDVATAKDGADALKQAVSLRPELVISDVWMPDGPAFVAMERLKNFGLSEVPLIFITASKQKELLEIAREIGAVGLFEKPFDADELLAVVKDTLAGRQETPTTLDI